MEKHVKKNFATGVVTIGVFCLLVMIGHLGYLAFKEYGYKAILYPVLALGAPFFIYYVGAIVNDIFLLHD